MYSPTDAYPFDNESPEWNLGLTTIDVLHEQLKTIIIPRMADREERCVHYLLYKDEEFSECTYCLECADKVEAWLTSGAKPSGYEISDSNEHPTHWMPCNMNDLRILEYPDEYSSFPLRCALCGVHLKFTPDDTYLELELEHFERWLPTTSNEWCDLWVIFQHGFDYSDVMERLSTIVNKAIEAEWNHTDLP